MSRGKSVVVALAVSLVLAMTACSPSPENPLEGARLYVNPDSSAARAAADEADPESRAAFDELASVPSAIWLLPEAHPTSEIAGYVDGIVSEATSQGALAVLVGYGIPSRDCGNFSAGGTASDEYGPWISAIAEGVSGRRVVIILEPDALALAPDCGTEVATAALLKDAVARLQADETTIYLDGGHSNWRPAEEMAALLTAAGVADVRGFATNVSNYNPTETEQEYGEQLSALLDGAHYVVDTSRNGNGSNGEWCNPSGRSIGVTPSGVAGLGAQDGSLWIKTPGESDGNCNGGPAAGQWWPQSALELVRGK